MSRRRGALVLSPERVPDRLLGVVVIERRKRMRRAQLLERKPGHMAVKESKESPATMACREALPLALELRQTGAVMGAAGGKFARRHPFFHERDDGLARTQLADLLRGLGGVQFGIKDVRDVRRELHHSKAFAAR